MTTLTHEINLAKERVEIEFYNRCLADDIVITYVQAKSHEKVYTPISPATPESTRFYANIEAAENAMSYIDAITDILQAQNYDETTDPAWAI